MPSPSTTPGLPSTANPPLGTPTVELPAYVPGELIDVASADLARPTRGIRPRRRSRLQRFLIGLTSGTALIVLGGLLALATVLSPFGAQRQSREAAERELRSELEDGEHVLARAFVSQRNWWDNFRESFGLLAATDRRLVFIGLPPVSWLRREDDDGPPELRVQSFSFDAPFTAEPHRLLLWTSPGVVVQTTSGDVKFLVGRGEGAHVRQIDSLVSQARIAQSQAIEREQIGFRAPPPPPIVYVSHVVRSGESVTSIARRYRTTPDVIRQLNRLPDDRIRIGQRLRVPQTPAGADSAAATAAATAAAAAPRPAQPQRPQPPQRPRQP